MKPIDQETNHWRLDSQCANELAQIPIYEVARIAATVLRDEAHWRNDQTGNWIESAALSVKATAKAFELLEIAYYGNFGLKHFNGSYEAGLAHIVESKKLDETIEAGIAAMPKYDFKLDANGKELVVPFDDGLAAVIPKPGVRKAQEANVRIERFKEWLIDRWREGKPEQDEQARLKECEDRIRTWKDEGIPAGSFSTFLRLYPDWWKQRKSRTNSANAKRRPTEQREKGRQGRVRGGKDKRRGARPPDLRNLRP